MFFLQKAQFFKILFFLSSCLIFFLLTYKIDRFMLEKEKIISYYNSKERKKIEENLNLYYKILMDFYATGGQPQLINNMPASKMVKHEIFKDIGMLGQNGYVMVLDLLDSKIEEFKFLNSREALVKIKETWNFQYQEIFERRSVNEITTTEVKVIYDFIRDKDFWFIKELGYWKR